MFTASGNIFTLTEGALTVHDVGVHLSRIPRWAGGTLYRWSVLQHSLVMYGMVARRDYMPVRSSKGCGAAPSEIIEAPTGRFPSGPEVALACLWHDAHEAVTEDIPPPFKVPEQRALQDDLDHRLWRDTLHVPFPDERTWELVRWLDAVCATAEAYTVCPSGVANYFPPPDPKVVDAIKARALRSQIDLAGVSEFTTLTHQLVREIYASQAGSS